MRTLRALLKWVMVVVTILLVTAVLLVRFTDGQISSPDHIVLGYDEEAGRFQVWEKKTYRLQGTDGPYVIGDQVYRVTQDGQFLQHSIRRGDTLTVIVDNADEDQFPIVLQDTLTPPPDRYDMPERMLVMSDIEGNFNAFAGLMQKHGVIDDQFKWTFGAGHLVLTGDFVDRGEQVTQVLWLIYKLESEALRQSGRVHYILGNHEVMNFHGNASANKGKYIRAAQLISGNDTVAVATRFIYSEKTALGRWLRSRNIIEKIGPYVYMHGGISPDLLKYRVSIADINRLAKTNWNKIGSKQPDESQAEDFITGSKGIYWYRGLATATDDYPKITGPELDRVLAFYGGEKLVFGHTLQDTITLDFGGKTINTDVRHGSGKEDAKTMGLFIENGIEYVVDGRGSKKRI